MIRSFTLSVVLGVGASAACTLFVPEIRTDTLAGGTVVVTRINHLGEGDPVVDTVSVSSPQGFRTAVQAVFDTTPLIFVGYFDSLLFAADSSPGGLPSPRIDMAPHIVDTGFSGYYAAYVRLHVDTVLKGSFPVQPVEPVWLRVESGYATCTVPMRSYISRRFLNFSTGFSARSDLNVNFSLAPQQALPEAYWFDGKYLLSPEFPGLSFDIVDLYPDYPATSIQPARPPLRPGPTDGRAEGRSYRPDGRSAPERDARRSPVPLLK